MSFRIVRTPVPAYVRTTDEAEQWVQYFRDESERTGLGYDTETTGLDVIRDRIRFFSFGTRLARICAPVRLLEVFAPLLEDCDIEKRMTNAKFDMHMTKNHGVHVLGPVLDTADMDFLADENRQGQHGLKECALDYLGLRMTPFKEVFGNAGSTDDEVRTLCEIHDVLELHDYEGERERAQEWARDILIRLDRLEGAPELVKAVNRLHLSLRAKECTLTARQVITVAEHFGVVEQHSGTLRYVSEFASFLNNCGEIPTKKERQALLHITEDPDALREVTEQVYDALLAKTGIPEDPVEYLRESTSDYSSLDAWGSHQLVDAFRELLAGNELPHPSGRGTIVVHAPEMITEAVLEGKEEPRLLLQHSEEDRVPFIRTLFNMERRGFAIDVEATKPYAVEMQRVVDAEAREIVRETRDINFNPNSPPQLLDKLFTYDDEHGWRDKFGDPPKKWTSGGTSGTKAPSTDKSVLEDFAGKDLALARHILTHRQFRKLKADYMEGLPRWVDRNRRIHTVLKSTGAVTWRLSSADPNLQNIPAKDPYWGKRIRRIFVAGRWGDCSPELCLEHLRRVPVPRLPADQKMRLIVADYKQLEICVMAHYCQDEGMVDSIWAKQDLHCKTVALASALGAAGLPKGITYEVAVAAKKAADVKGHVLTKMEEFLIRMRGQLKSTIFGIIYGIGAVKLGMQLGLPIVKHRGRNGKVRDTCPEAQALIDSILWEIYPGLGAFIEETHEQCRRDLVVYTVAGHPRRLPDIISNDRGRAAQAERQSVNVLPQGSGADIVNKAMLKCEGDEELRRLGARLLLQIHDELIFEVPDLPEYVEPAKARIKQLMENPYPMRVPILVDLGDGDNWGDAKH